MRTLDRRFLAAVIPVSLLCVTAGGTLLTGCGGGGGSNASSLPLPGGGTNTGTASGGTNTGTASGGTNTGTTGTSTFAGRSYTVSSLTLPGGRTGVVALQVSSANVPSGTLTLTSPADSVPLTGTLNAATGAYQLTGTLTRAAGDPVVVNGTLPAPPAATGGSLNLTVNGQSVSAPFTAPSTNPTPTPSGATPTPNPTPSPTPSGSPGSGTGTYGEYVLGFNSTANDTFTFNYTTTYTDNPDPRGENSGPTPGTNTIQGPLDAFGTPFIGQNKTTVTIQLPVSGSKVVTREEYINPATGKVAYYGYYTETSSGRTDYGTDNVENGVVTSSTRYEGGPGGGAGFFPYNFSPGQSFSTTDTDYETEYDSTGAVTEQYSYQETNKITFVGLETVTVAAGTFTNVAHFRFESSYIDPATSTDDVDRPHMDTDDYYLSKFAGRVKAVFHNVTQNEQGRDNNGNAYTYSSTFDGTNELASATVNGTNYPPGRSTRPVSNSGTLPQFMRFSPHYHPHTKTAKQTKH